MTNVNSVDQICGGNMVPMLLVRPVCVCVRKCHGGAITGLTLFKIYVPCISQLNTHYGLKLPLVSSFSSNFFIYFFSSMSVY